MAREIKSTIDTNTNTLRIEVAGKQDIVVLLGMLSSEMLDHACLHGLKQKIVDSAALGQGYTLTEKYNAMVETFDRITSSDPSWNKRAEGSSTVTGLLYRALCRLYPDKSPEALRAYHDKLDKSQQSALRKNPRIAPIIEEIKLEKVSTTGIDSDSLLNELEDI